MNAQQWSVLYMVGIDALYKRGYWVWIWALRDMAKLLSFLSFFLSLFIPTLRTILISSYIQHFDWQTMIHLDPSVLELYYSRGLLEIFSSMCNWKKHEPATEHVPQTQFTSLITFICTTDLIPQQEDDLLLFILGLMRHENCPIHLPIRIPNYGQFATNAMEHLALSIMKTDNYTISTPH